MRYLCQLIFQLTFQLVGALLLSSSIYLTAAAEPKVAVTDVAQTIVIGSKNFGESYLLSEIAAQLLERQGFAVERRFGLGGTLICYEALRNGEIDFYIEYTGTLSQAVLKMPGRPTRKEINAELRTLGLQILSEIGFNNTYAVAVRESQAQELSLCAIGDLA